MRSTHKRTAQAEESSLRNLQKIAKQTPSSIKPKTSDITSSAQLLGRDIDELQAHLYAVATYHHVGAGDVLDELDRRMNPERRKR